MKNKLMLITFSAVLASLALIFFIGQNKPEIKNTENKEIDKRPDSLVNYLDFSKDYYVDWHDANSVTIHVEYPDMRPNVPNHDFSVDKAIRIYIRGIRGGDEVETFLSHVYTDSAKNCQISICYARKMEATKEFGWFREGTEDDYANKKGEATDYYLFEAFDGQKILVDDSGAWAKSHLVKRNIDNFFIIEYQFPKKIVTHSNINEKIEYDFKVIDKTVTEFIKKQINFNKNEKDFKNVN